MPTLPFSASTMARPQSPTTNCRHRCHRRRRRRRRQLRRAPHPLVVSSGRPPPGCLASSVPPLSSSRPPPAHLAPPSLPPPPPLVVLSAARPPRGNIATALSLRPPPNPSRSLQAVHCRLLHVVSTRTSPPPLLTKHPPCQRTKASIIAKKATAFATAVTPLASSGARNVVGIAPPRRRRRRVATTGEPM